MVADLTIADVTSRSVSLVWASREPVLHANVRVFSDSAGANEISESLGQSFISALFPSALDAGLVKVQLSGLQPDSCVYVLTETTAIDGLHVFPSTLPLVQVCTARELTRRRSSGAPIVNDLLAVEEFLAEGALASTTLVLIRAPRLSTFPVSTFVGDRIPASRAVVNLNNLVSSNDRVTVSIEPQEQLEIVEFRGRACPLSQQKLTRFRVAPDRDEIGQVGTRITEVETPGRCAPGDVGCDGDISVADAQAILGSLTASFGSCGFSSDLDIVADGTLNILDVQAVLNRVGPPAVGEASASSDESGAASALSGAAGASTSDPAGTVTETPNVPALSTAWRFSAFGALTLLGGWAIRAKRRARPNERSAL